ncbi:hypothetical protein HOO65_050623 [Ceratocystis lukuohia]|uniref:Uncharacterized protein n=1 Tax=Ceratocystis lukuohia TaxID=2019550 RepID=A0ABR4MGU0_9PEZI
MKTSLFFASSLGLAMAIGSDTVVPVPVAAALSAHADPQGLAEASSSRVRDGETSDPVITAAPELELPANLKELKSFEIPYNKDLINNIKKPEDFFGLPDFTVYVYGQKTVISAWAYFTQKLEEVSKGRTSFVAHEFFAAAATTSHAPSFSSGPAIVPGGSAGELAAATQTVDPTITAAPELPPNLNEIDYFKVPYNEKLIEQIKNPEDFFGLPDYTVYTYGRKTVVPAWQHFYKKLREVSQDRTSFIAHEFFAAVTAAARASSSSSGPVSATPAAINAPPIMTDTPQTSNNAVATNPNIDLPDNLHEIPRFEVPYDMSLLDNVKTAEDLANLPDAIVFEHGKMRRVTAIQRFASKLFELVEASTTSINPFDIFKFGPDYDTEEPQASTTFSTIIRTASRDPLEIGV